MPMRTYRCARDHRIDVLEPREAPPAYCPACGGATTRHDVYRTRVLGPVYEAMDRYNLAHFSPAELRAGKGFRDARDLRRWQDAHGVTEADPSSRSWRSADEDAADEVSTIDRVRREDGPGGVAAWEREEEVRTAVPEWSKAEYVAWRNRTDAVATDHLDALADALRDPDDDDDDSADIDSADSAADIDSSDSSGGAPEPPDG